MPQKRKKLTDTYIRSRKPAKPGQRDATMDTVHPRLGLRVTDKGHKSFIYLSRFPGSSNPTRRALGSYPTTTLEEAREGAREWDVLLAKGIDPSDEAQRIGAENEKAKADARDNAFHVHVTRYLEFAKDQRQIHETKRIFNKELMPVWHDRPIDTITPSDVKAVILDIAARSPSAARNVLTVCKSFFDWVLDEKSPAAPLRPKKIIGKKKPRQTLLTDDELRAFWSATDKLGYPYRDLYRLLLLTGVRLREGSGAGWPEIDAEKRLWTIPPARFKSDCTHIVPLSDMTMQLIEQIPRFVEGDHLFSHSYGRKPVNSFSKSKARLDALMAEELGAVPQHWVIHDLRRAVRTRLAALKIPDSIAEMVLGHGHGDALQRTYDLHSYQDELRDALDRWAAKLRDIVMPPDPTKVIKLAM